MLAQNSLFAGSFDPDREGFSTRDLAEGETVTGEVARLPEPGARYGNWVFLRPGNDRVIALLATGRHGRTVLEREIARLEMRVGERVRIDYVGQRTTADGMRTYRHYRVERVR